MSSNGLGRGGFGPDENPAGRNPAGRNPAGRNPAGRNPAGRNPAGRNPEGRTPFPEFRPCPQFDPLHQLETQGRLSTDLRFRLDRHRESCLRCYSFRHWVAIHDEILGEILGFPVGPVRQRILRRLADLRGPEEALSGPWPPQKAPKVLGSHSTTKGTRSDNPDPPPQRNISSQDLLAQERQYRRLYLVPRDGLGSSWRESGEDRVAETNPDVDISRVRDRLANLLVVDARDRATEALRGIVEWALFFRSRPDPTLCPRHTPPDQAELRARLVAARKSLPWIEDPAARRASNLLDELRMDALPQTPQSRGQLADDLLREARRLTPDSLDLHTLAAVVDRERGYPEITSTLRSWECLLSTDSTRWRSQALVQMSNWRASRGHLAAARQLADRCHRSDPDRWDAVFNCWLLHCVGDDLPPAVCVRARSHYAEVLSTLFARGGRIPRDSRDRIRESFFHALCACRHLIGDYEDRYRELSRLIGISQEENKELAPVAEDTINEDAPHEWRGVHEYSMKGVELY